MEAKSNEITALPELIEALDLNGATVTLDAMGCQEEVARLLVDKGADYVLGLKGNQGTLHRQVKRCFDVTEWKNYKDFAHWGHATQGSGHGRREQRRCIALACPQGAPFDAWKGMRTMAMNLLRLSPLKKTLPKKRLKAYQCLLARIDIVVIGSLLTPMQQVR